MTCALTSSSVLVLRVPVETAEKIRRVCEKNLAGCLTPCFSPGVPDSPDPDKEILGIRIERTLKRRIQVAAKASGKTITEFVREILIEKTSHVTLSSRDYEKIAEKVRKAEAKLSEKGGA